MAVVDVWAEINGHYANLIQTDDITWSIVAPSDCPDGSYTCAFWAVDGAGNSAYKTAILWIFDGKLTCINWIEDKYSVKYLVCNFTAQVRNLAYSSKIKESLYSAHALPDVYSCHYIKVRCPND